MLDDQTLNGLDAPIARNPAYLLPPASIVGRRSEADSRAVQDWDYQRTERDDFLRLTLTKDDLKATRKLETTEKDVPWVPCRRGTGTFE